MNGTEPLVTGGKYILPGMRYRSGRATGICKESCGRRPRLETLVLELLAAMRCPGTYLDAVPEFQSDRSGRRNRNYSRRPDRTVQNYRRVGKRRYGRRLHGGTADKQFTKRMALKLVKRGMDTDEILLRFRHERQILASLEHPNIARLYDGGAADDGRPYLVMEYM
jgi:eukaryotic-like serine/threonine-protein kinase